jgi:hypothetical protein
MCGAVDGIAECGVLRLGTFEGLTAQWILGAQRLIAAIFGTYIDRL